LFLDFTEHFDGFFYNLHSYWFSRWNVISLKTDYFPLSFNFSTISKNSGWYNCRYSINTCINNYAAHCPANMLRNRRYPQKVQWKDSGLKTEAIIKKTSSRPPQEESRSTVGDG
jgi:hypothetical protein